MGIFSKELQELDRNTVQYMIDEMQDQINQQKADLDEKQETIDQQKADLDEKQETIDQQKADLDEKDRLLTDALERIRELEAQLKK